MLRTSEASNVHAHGQPFEVIVDVTTPEPVQSASLAWEAKNELEQTVVCLWTFDTDLPMCRAAGTHRIVCRIPTLRMYMGNYSVNVSFGTSGGGEVFDRVVGVCPFEINMHGKSADVTWVPGLCTYLEDCEWEIDSDVNPALPG
jgi:lipopolysaccharide transport system ATP-binding protein